MDKRGVSRAIVLFVLVSVALFLDQGRGSDALMIRIQQPQVVLTVFPGETTSYAVVVHNGLGRSAVANFTAVASFVNGTRSEFIRLACPSPSNSFQGTGCTTVLHLQPGNTILQIQEEVAGDAPPLTYHTVNSVRLL